MPQFQLENIGSTEGEADPSSAELQMLTATAPVIDVERSDPPVTSINPVHLNCNNVC